MGRLAVITLTLNEEANIGPCLESVRWADERIVVDSGSTDRTLEIARNYTERILTIPWEGYGAARNRAIEESGAEWILWLDADERVTPDLAVEIRAIVSADDPSVDGYAIARRAYFLGRWIRHSGWYPSRVVRLFRRARGHFSEHQVHERLEFSGSVRTTRHDLLHFTDPNLVHYLTKLNRYTTLAATDMMRAGRHFSFADLLLRPPFQFFKMYVLRLGMLDGIQGFMLCVLSAAYVFTKYAKLWELQHGTTKED
jgi:glycosyltransferase involved in cell wall biosynthesis